MYKGLPTEDYVTGLRTRLRNRYQNQWAVDAKVRNLYLQRHVIDAKKSDGQLDTKAVGAGYGGFLVDSKTAVLNSTPFIRVIPRGTSGAERIASDRLEPFANTALYVMQEYGEVQEPVVQDLGLYGEAWTIGPIPAPLYWADEEMRNLVENGTKDQWDAYKEENFPIVWKHVDTCSVMESQNDRGEPAEVLIEREMFYADVMDRWGLELPKMKDDSKLTVCDYYNSTHMAVYVFSEQGGMMGVGRTMKATRAYQWEHHMGCVPMCKFSGGALPQNDYGWFRKGLLFHARALIEARDSVLTDFYTIIRDYTERKPVITMNATERANIEGWPTTIDYYKEPTITLLQGETAAPYPTPEPNPALLQFFGITGSVLETTSIREPLIGTGPSGQSAVHLNEANQIAKAELASMHKGLIRGYSNAGKLLFKSVIALNAMMPKGAEDAVTIRSANAAKGQKEISVKPADVEGSVHLVRADVDLQLPVNEGAAVQNASIAVQGHILSKATARERFLNVQNPLEEADRIAEEALADTLLGVYIQVLQQRALAPLQSVGITPPTTADMQGLPAFAQEAITRFSQGQISSPEMGNAARGMTSEARSGRGQRMSQLSGMNGSPVGQ